VSASIRIGAIALAMLLALACGTPRLLIATGTTIGMKVAPGDGKARPPQVTFAYKRAEVAVVPSPSSGERGAERDAGGNLVRGAYSTLAAFSFYTTWFGETRLDSVIATGHAARRIQDPVPEEGGQDPPDGD